MTEVLSLDRLTPENREAFRELDEGGAFETAKARVDFLRDLIAEETTKAIQPDWRSLQKMDKTRRSL